MYLYTLGFTVTVKALYQIQPDDLVFQSQILNFVLTVLQEPFHGVELQWSYTVL